MVKREFLDRLTSDCIEANDLNLSAGRFKPLSIAKARYDPPPVIISELQDIESRIQDGLANLLALVEESL